MKKLLYLFLVFLGYSVQAQEFLPFASGPYAGVTGVQLQPASIADSRYKLDVNLSSTSFCFSNNYANMDLRPLWSRKEFENPDFEDLYITYNNNDNPKSGFISVKQDVCSFMLSLSEKDAIAFTPSVRAMINFDDVSQNLLDLLRNNWDVPSLFNQQLTNSNLSLQANAWAEYGFTYARVVYDNKEHFIKAGATLKLLQGLGSGHLYGRNINYNVKNEDTLSIYASEINYGVTNNLTYDDIDQKDVYKLNSQFSVGMDFGIVYEYRPKWMDYKYDMDGKTNLWRRDQDKYLLKIGLSVTDVGRVRYTRGALTRDFNANVSNMNIRDVNIYDYDDFNYFIDSVFDYSSVKNKYTMNLPLNISLQADVRIFDGFYVNFIPYLALLRGNNDVNKTHYLTSINLIPRYERTWFGASLPIQYNSNSKFNVGLGLRIGPFWLGSNDFFSTLISGKVNRMSVSALLKVPILYKKPHDRDNDHVSDKMDLCKDNPGPWEKRGCPDTDGDGIVDSKDRCPDVPGIPAFDGCPDRDGDSIIDMNDDCPDQKGPAKYKGCPDTDGDGILDKNDDCPLVAGIPAFNGCPDTDGDGIADKDDNCPTVPGTIENKGCPYIDTDNDGIADKDDECPTIPGQKIFNGCPDTDGDGISDKLDNCPTEPGTIENKGCPFSDTDKDGIPDNVDDCPTIAGQKIFNGCPDTDGDSISDKYDMCPTVKGIPANKGCPEIKKEEQETIRKAFDNLEFETGKAIIRASSYFSLDELAGVMKKRLEFKLLIAGHTDNVGDDASNMTLSKNRTIAVRDYLVKKGIDASRFKTEWYGETRPIAPNETPEGRQKNRRVEMNIFF
mgnify:CR=1 FL=1